MNKDANFKISEKSVDFWCFRGGNLFCGSKVGLSSVSIRLCVIVTRNAFWCTQPSPAPPSFRPLPPPPPPPLNPLWTPPPPPLLHSLSTSPFHNVVMSGARFDVGKDTDIVMFNGILIISPLSLWIPGNSPRLFSFCLVIADNLVGLYV